MMSYSTVVKMLKFYNERHNDTLAGMDYMDLNETQKYNVIAEYVLECKLPEYNINDIKLMNKLMTLYLNKYLYNI